MLVLNFVSYNLIELVGEQRTWAQAAVPNVDSDAFRSICSFYRVGMCQARVHVMIIIESSSL